MTTRRWIGLVVFFFFVSAAAARPSRVERKLVALKADVMTADYRADLPKLTALRDRAARLSGDPDLGYLADYWSGFASWRIVVNGASAKMTPDEAKAHLGSAAADFESSFHKKDDFADAYSSAAAVHGWLAAYKRADEAAMNEEIATYKRLLNRALELEPSNPRTLWIQAVPYIVLPPERGGNRDRAIELYHRMFENAGPPKPESPLPDWGKVEALMSLSSANLNKPSPDLDVAEEEARAALRLRPDWHYVRDILVPQIDAKRKQQSETGAKQQ
jgi:hypothetical protein